MFLFSEKKTAHFLRYIGLYEYIKYHKSALHGASTLPNHTGSLCHRLGFTVRMGSKAKSGSAM